MVISPRSRTAIIQWAIETGATSRNRALAVTLGSPAGLKPTVRPEFAPGRRLWPMCRKKGAHFANFAVTKSSKVTSRPFPKRTVVGTYRPRPHGLRGQGLPSQEASGRKLRPRGVDPAVSVFEQGAQKFIAGWSSPVARQAHNLKVIGSNPIPATKFKPRNPVIAGFCFAVISRCASLSSRQPLSNGRKQTLHFFAQVSDRLAIAREMPQQTSLEQSIKQRIERARGDGRLSAAK